MPIPVQGLHHVTALASQPNPNIEFYAGVLGLRLLKISVNPDVPSAYQLFYGNETGRPGTILSFYCFPQYASPMPGRDFAHSIGLSVPSNTLGYWRKRLKKFGIAYSKEKSRFNEKYIELNGPDGLKLELVSTEGDVRPAYGKGTVERNHAIKGIHHINLSLLVTARMQEFLLDYVGYQHFQEEHNRLRFGLKMRSGNFVDLSAQPGCLPGILGLGGIHHVAYHVPSKRQLVTLRKQLAKAGADSSPILDRTYFHSFFFTIGEGMFMEIATSAPGFSVDEPLDSLGTSLKLPKSLAKEKKNIEKALPKLNFNLDKYK